MTLVTEVDAAPVLFFRVEVIHRFYLIVATKGTSESIGLPFKFAIGADEIAFSGCFFQQA